MRRVAVAAVVLAAVPATASAAPFGELPFQPVRSAAVCLAPTGTPGELVRWAPGGAEVLRATATGLVPEASVALGQAIACPVAATQPGGAGVIAAPSVGGLRIAVREPGHGWGAPVTITGKRQTSLAVATSARGDAVVAWEEYDPAKPLVRVVQRVAGGAFGAPVRVAGSFERPSLATAVSGDGAALLAIADRGALRLSSAAPGAPFGAPRTLARGEDYGGGVTALAVTPDGRALLAADLGNGLALFDRDPGSAFVQRPTVSGSGAPAIALAPDGTAVVATGSGESVSAVMRDGLAAFGAPISLSVPRRSRSDGFGVSFALIGDDDGPPLETTTPLRVTLGADRRALLAWSVENGGLRAATLTTAGAGEVASVAGPLRAALGATPVVLDDGARAIAWTDGNDVLSSPPYAGRLHYAVEGAADAPVPGPPEVSVGAPRDRSLRPAQDLVLPVRCSAACDVRVTVRGVVPEPTFSLPGVGSKLVRLQAFGGAIAPARGTLALALTFSAPGARTQQRRTVHVRLRRLPAPPFPRVLNARATRGRGGVVDVRWSTDVPARDVYFAAYGSHRDAYRTDPDLNVKAAIGKGQRSFHIRLRDAARIRYVRLQVFQIAGRRTSSVKLNVRSRA